jgi:putative ABC transport system permease protein
MFPPRVYILAVALFLIMLATLAIATAENARFVTYFILGCVLVFSSLWLAARGLMRLAARWHPRNAPDLRLALANLYRPGAATPSVMLSLGIGLTLLVTVSLIQGNIAAEIQRELPARAPSFFFVDIQLQQSAEFEALVRAAPGLTSFERVPMLRGRIVSVRGVPADKVKVASDVAWALRGDRGVTYSADLPSGSILKQGTWWARDYKGPLLVSLTEELAQGMGLKLGDEITVNILGRVMSARLANKREVNWRSLGINFVLVFSPGALEGAPHTELATVTMAEPGEQALERQVAIRFPNVTSVRVKEALNTISDLMRDFSLGLRSIGLLTLAAGVLVLAGAMASGFRARARDAAILKTLGATRARILGIYLREYAMTGFATALIALLAGAVGSWFVVTYTLEMNWVLLPVTLFGTVLGAVFLTVTLGLAASWRAMSVPAARMLRGEAQEG